MGKLKRHSFVGTGKVIVRPKQMAVTALKQPESLYYSDICAWAEQQKDLLQKGDFKHVDMENVIEEIDAVGKSERRELLSHMIILLLHMLKYDYQPNMRTRSWQRSIHEARKQVKITLEDSPSLKRELPAVIERAYSYALNDAVFETGMPLKTFPKKCPWSKSEILTDLE